MSTSRSLPLLSGLPAILLLALTATAGCSAHADQDSGAQSEDVTTGAVASKDAFFAEDMYFVRINGWNPSLMTPASLDQSQTTAGAELIVYKTNAKSTLHCPDAQQTDADVVYRTKSFALHTSGNLTNGTPKSSYKVDISDKNDRLFGMKALNLKSMWNDVSQMREALAWKIFEKAGVAAPRHTYAKFCINDRYYGLYSVIEQVDTSFLKDHFAAKDGNLFKAYWPTLNGHDLDIGAASLAYRKSGSDDSGKQYFSLADNDARTYRLSGSGAAGTDTYDDLAAFIRVLNGVTLPDGPSKFDTQAYKDQMEKVFNVKSFLRWASANMLLGAWDNYYATPANYYLYNSGSKAHPEQLMSAPYMTWIPWDYDNTFGNDFFNTKWQYNDIVDWPSGTRNYYKGAATSNIPLLTNLLANQDYLKYYLDSIEYLADTTFTEAFITGMIGTEAGPGLRARVQTAAFLEADGPSIAPHTGRQFTNDEVFQNGLSYNELNRGSFHSDGILHYVRMRHDNVKDQLKTLRVRFPKGSSGAQFPVKSESIP